MCTKLWYMSLGAHFWRHGIRNHQYMNTCWNQMAGKVTWRVNSEKRRAEQGNLVILYQFRAGGGRGDPEKTEEWWTRPASNRAVQSLLQAQSLAGMTSWTGSRLLCFSLLPNVQANTEWIDAGVSSAPRGVVWPEFRAQCSLWSLICPSRLFRLGRGPTALKDPGITTLKAIACYRHFLVCSAFLLPLSPFLLPCRVGCGIPKVARGVRREKAVKGGRISRKELSTISDVWGEVIYYIWQFRAIWDHIYRVLPSSDSHENNFQSHEI